MEWSIRGSARWQTLTIHKGHRTVTDVGKCGDAQYMLDGDGSIYWILITSFHSHLKLAVNEAGKAKRS